jgi:hypothetical protein
LDSFRTYIEERSIKRERQNVRVHCTAAPRIDQSSSCALQTNPHVRLNNLEAGKIMGRIIGNIAEDEFGNLGDTSTLTDPAAVDDLVNSTQNPSKESASSGLGKRN